MKNILQIDKDGVRIIEASLAVNSSHSALRGHLHAAIKKAHGVTGWTEDGPWVNHDGVFPTHVVYQHKGETFKRKYTAVAGEAGADPAITLGDAKKVHIAYVDSKCAEALSLLINGAMLEESDVIITSGDIVTESVDISTITESTSALPKPVLMKLIAPGWGSKAYYSEAVLRRDGPSVFKKGTHMMWNHMSESELVDRPEGNLNDLAAVLIKDAYYAADGPKGAGLYAEAKVFGDYAQQLADKGPHIGVSINAGVRTHEGEAEGRSGRIADKFVWAQSVDFVTHPGAGGAPIVPVKESTRVPQSEITEVPMTPEEKAQHDAVVAENATLRESLAKKEKAEQHSSAVAAVGAALTEAGISYNAKVLSRACQNPVYKDGKLDEKWQESIVAEFSEDETGRVREMGGDPSKDKETDESVDKAFEAEMSKLVPAEGLKSAMRGR